MTQIVHSALIILTVLHGALLAQKTVENGTTDKAVTPLNRTAIIHKYNNWLEFADRFVPWALWADRYVTLIYYIIGFPGNLISTIVWTSRRVYKGNSAAVYLAALSVNDIIILIFALHRDLGRNWGVFSRNTPGACEVLITVFSAVQYASPLYVLGFTVERWLAVCRPFLIDRICNAKRAIFICSLICAGTILISLGNAVRFGTEPTHCYKKIDGFAINFYLAFLEGLFSGIVPLMVLIFNCLVIRELARVHRNNKNLESTSHRVSCTAGTVVESEVTRRKRQKTREKPTVWQRMIHCHLCPLWKQPSRESISGTARIPLVRDSTQSEIMKPHERASRSGGMIGVRRATNGTRVGSVTSPTNPEERHSPSFRSTTFMLLCVSFYMIIATLLAGLMYLLNHIFDEPDLTLTEEEALKDRHWLMTIRILTIKTFGDEIAMSYYAFGFIIYYATGHSFRERVHQLFRMVFIRCGCCRESFTKCRTSEDFQFASTSRRAQRRPTTAPCTVSINPFQLDADGTNKLSGEKQSSSQITGLNGSSSAAEGIPIDTGYFCSKTEHDPGVPRSNTNTTTTKLDSHFPVPDPEGSNAYETLNALTNHCLNGLKISTIQQSALDDPTV
ncbi:Rhodopsin orphan GPCR [Fasciola hepatica]|uniref:Rhodopsin orphan GPCR n=1 Tax=Fasciola hepatica TaxID=6192 RepID=A0A2H1CSN3_FASHE|nr:Rhodopsin orphan GPCR [Fasciola hepatica]